ncbi:hypothetical protein PsYK624_031270 [Phanerochaete sordida]|uniref:Uncharacterized protein n=1 Tax=Phanerochaete sordida TaxID=48140 RepID=A0A9P3G374_9APHY|nr:hypothetical protein PsYK624_031270 [Phanerochaete sordida]
MTTQLADGRLQSARLPLCVLVCGYLAMPIRRHVATEPHALLGEQGSGVQKGRLWQPSTAMHVQHLPLEHLFLQHRAGFRDARLEKVRHIKYRGRGSRRGGPEHARGCYSSAQKLFWLLSIQAYVRADLYPQVSGADFILHIELGGARPRCTLTTYRHVCRARTISLSASI